MIRVEFIDNNDGDSFVQYAVDMVCVPRIGEHILLDGTETWDGTVADVLWLNMAGTRTLYAAVYVDLRRKHGKAEQPG